MDSDSQEKSSRGGEEKVLKPQTSMCLHRPRILLMGPRRSGKSSIQRVVFQKMSPHETLFLESTTALSIKFIANNPYVQFEVWDFPGDVDLADGVVFEDQVLSPDLIFGNCAALAYVIDAQDDPSTEALSKFHEIVTIARSVNQNMHFEVFIHKVDGDLFLSEDHKLDCQRDIQEQVELELEDAADTEITLSFYLTSIYDHSIFEAFSKVVHKLIPQLPAMENLLNIFIANCEVEKAFLFDVVSKIYIATDHNPVDIQSYELCSDMIDVVIDVSCIYGMKEGEPLTMQGAPVNRRIADDAAPDGAAEGPTEGDASPTDATTDGLNDTTAGNVTGEESEGPTGIDSEQQKSGPAGSEDFLQDEQQKREDLAFDRDSASLIRLNNNMILYLRQVASYLALACIVRTPNYEKQGLIDYNVECFRKALAKLFCKEEDYHENETK
mmetsp:Transcript_18488/g.30134  ORF Transcript_18488/g.30134 Transcript_18488/m.30134 type:complete len:440 (+) Transcript_18488:34-1353(+)